MKIRAFTVPALLHHSEHIRSNMPPPEWRKPSVGETQTCVACFSICSNFVKERIWEGYVIKNGIWATFPVFTDRLDQGTNFNTWMETQRQPNSDAITVDGQKPKLDNYMQLYKWMTDHAASPLVGLHCHWFAVESPSMYRKWFTNLSWRLTHLLRIWHQWQDAHSITHYRWRSSALIAHSVKKIGTSAFLHTIKHTRPLWLTSTQSPSLLGS